MAIREPSSNNFMPAQSARGASIVTKILVAPSTDTFPKARRHGEEEREEIRESRIR
jgi:hypothetical protein